MSPDQDQSVRPYVPRGVKREGNDQYGSKLWIENQIIVIVKTAMRGKPAMVSKGRTRRDGTVEVEHPVAAVPINHALALTGLMQLAKLKGFVVEKRQSLAGKVDLNKLSPVDLKAMLAQTIDQLSPGERNRIIEIADGSLLDPEDTDPAE